MARKAWLTFACLLALAVPLAADETSGWAVGGDLKRQLTEPITVSWANVPLRTALTRFAATQHLAVMLDRRIDPDQPLELSLAREPLGQALEKIARRVHAGYSQFGPVAYLGPPEAAAQLCTLAALRLDDVRRLSPAVARRLLLLRNSHWEELAEPKQLLAALAQEADVTLQGLERVEHDLWPAADLPPLSWIDRVTLIAFQFGLTFQIKDGGKAIELAPIPAEVTLARNYQAGRNAPALAKRWAKDLPSARVEVTGNQIRLTGRLEDHEHVEARLRGVPTQKATVTAGQEMYHLAIENAALSSVLEQLAERLNLQFDWQPEALRAAGISPDQLITIKVQDATLDGLLQAVFKDTGLQFQRNDRTVTITPAREKKP